MLQYITWAADPNIIESPVTVRWYGLMFAIGFIIGYNIIARMFRHEGGSRKMVGLTVPMGYGRHNNRQPAWDTCFFLRMGKVLPESYRDTIHLGRWTCQSWRHYRRDTGGDTLLLITTKRSPLWTFDRLVVPIALVGGLIRLGNLFNSEIFGHATDLPWGFMFVNSPQWHAMYEGQACHPTQIYEATCYFALFALLMWMYWKKNSEERPGLLLGVFFIGCFLSRFLVEFVKNDQVAWESSMSLNMGQLLSIPFILAGIFFVARAYTRPRTMLRYPNRFADTGSDR